MHPSRRRPARTAVSCLFLAWAVVTLGQEPPPGAAPPATSGSAHLSSFAGAPPAAPPAPGEADQPPDSGPAWSTVEDEKEGYRLHLPGDWVLRDLDAESVAPLVARLRQEDRGMSEAEADWVTSELLESLKLLAVESSPQAAERGLGAVFQLVRIPVGGPVSALEMARVAAEGPMPKGATVRTPVARSLPSGQGAVLEVTYDSHPPEGTSARVRERRLYVMRGDYAYMLGLATPDAADAAYRAAFERICESLEFTSAPPALVRGPPFLRLCPRELLHWTLLRMPAGPTGLTLKLPWYPTRTLVMPQDSLPSSVMAAAQCVDLNNPFFGLTIVSIKTLEGAISEPALLQELLAARARRMRAEAIPGREVVQAVRGRTAELKGVQAGRERHHAVRCLVLVEGNLAWILTAEYRTDDEVAQDVVDRILRSAKTGPLKPRRGPTSDRDSLSPPHPRSL